jgi:succinyl-CoA synthetase beta subunit/citryl-CoA synthetase large subunit
MIAVEYEAKALLQAEGLPIPTGIAVNTPEGARSAAQDIGAPVVIKAQVPVGGRMKAGAILFEETPDAAESAARHLLGRSVRGHTVETLLIERRLNISREVFIAATYDSAAREPTLIVSTEGGIEVESASNVVRFPFSVAAGIPDYIGRDAAAALGLSGSLFLTLSSMITRLARLFVDIDALLLECNPVILDTDGRWWITDVHLELDDDALSRQQRTLERLPYSAVLANRRSAFEQKALEIDQADHRGVAGRLIPFDGSIGALIGGGGASLTVMDALFDAGLKPANYCEIGGNPSVWKVKELTKLILGQPQVDRLIVIMNVVSNTRVDLVARGVIKGILELGHEPKDVIAAFRVPGSWEDEGEKLLRHYGIRFYGRETAIEQVIEQIG